MKNIIQDEFIHTLLKNYNLRYFLTVTFQRALSECVARGQIIFFLKILNQKTFGEKHKKNNINHEGLYFEEETALDAIHYHILLAGSQEFTKDKLFFAFSEATRKTELVTFTPIKAIKQQYDSKGTLGYIFNDKPQKLYNDIQGIEDGTQERVVSYCLKKMNQQSDTDFMQFL